MLKLLRGKASGVLGILLIGLLIIAFGLWGIADTFTGFSNSEIASVGDNKIERQEFQVRYVQQTREFSRQLGTPLSAADAQNLGILQQVLINMMGSAALQQAAEELGLGYSDEAIAQTILNEPSFAGLNGEFDEPTFRAVLAQNGLNEKLFVEDQRHFHITNQLTEASIDQGLVPKKLVEGLYQHFLERRVANYMILTLNQTDETGEPTVEELETFFNETKLRFAQPETRSGHALVVSPARFAELITIDRATLEEEYELTMNDYVVEEKRKIDQLVLADDSEADQVRTLLADNVPFVEIVAAVGQTLENSDLGEVARDDMISADLAESAFAMEQGDVSDVIEGPLGYVVLRVRDIKPGATLPLEVVEDQLRQRIIYDRALGDLLAFTETVEDELAGGETLENIGQRFDLDVIKINNIANNGKTPDDLQPAILARYDTLAGLLFESAIGEDIPMQEMEDGTFIWLRLNDITPTQVPPLDNVRAAVVAEWKIDERSKLLQAMAEHMVKVGNETGSFKSAAEGFKRKPLVSEPMTRQVSNDTFSEDAVGRLFAIDKDKFTWASVGFGGEIIVMQVTDIIDAELTDSAAREIIFDGERRKYHADLTNQFVQSLQQNFGVNINQRNLDMATRELVTR
ncbi:MAG: SurA N-terminal domain-containing protein [Alphaproteobacteria bacterium]|nr:SurA N-terminal domain-containing protein [Alphaproteobacteria bacterium]